MDRLARCLFFLDTLPANHHFMHLRAPFSGKVPGIIEDLARLSGATDMQLPPGEQPTAAQRVLLTVSYVLSKVLSPVIIPKCAHKVTDSSRGRYYLVNIG